MKRSRLLILAILLPVLTSSWAEVCAWSPETRVRIVEDALMMMPETLRTLLERHGNALRRGALEPLTEEGSPAHRPPWEDGTLPAEVARRADAVVAAVDGHEPFEVVAARFGALAHFVSDAGFPPLAGGGDDAGRYRHFTDLVGDRLEKIPFVFYGHGDPELGPESPEGYVLAILTRARDEDVVLARTYRAAGETPHPSAFDDRSVPFAIASLSYSRSVTDVVRVWLHAWGRAHGDMGRTPYLKSPTTYRRP